MRIGIISATPVDPATSSSQAQVCFLIRTLLELGHRVTHGHLAPTGYERAPFLRALTTVYPALRLAGTVRGPADLAGCAAAVLTNCWEETELEAAIGLADALVGGPTVVFDSMDCLATTYVGVWPDDRVRRLAALEDSLRARSALSVFISRCEALKGLRLCPALKGADVFVLPSCYERAPAPAPYDARRHVCFTGSLTPHNVSGATFFLERVWPRLTRLLPDAEFHLLGRIASAVRIQGPPELVNRIRARTAIPDMPAVVGGYRVSVAPVLTGSGVKGKTLESLSVGTPVVTTVAGAEGMPLVHNRNALLAPADETFADAVAAVYEDRPRWEQFSAEGTRLIRRRFSVHVFRNQVRRLVDRIRSTRSRNR